MQNKLRYAGRSTDVLMAPPQRQAGCHMEDFHALRLPMGQGESLSHAKFMIVLLELIKQVILENIRFVK